MVWRSTAITVADQLRSTGLIIMLRPLVLHINRNKLDAVMPSSSPRAVEIMNDIAIDLTTMNKDEVAAGPLRRAVN